MEAYPTDARALRLHADEEPPGESSELAAAALKYLNLCSESSISTREAIYRETSGIFGEDEMRRTLVSPLFRREWSKVRHEFDSYSEFARFVDHSQDGKRS